MADNQTDDLDGIVLETNNRSSVLDSGIGSSASIKTNTEAFQGNIEQNQAINRNILTGRLAEMQAEANAIRSQNRNRTAGFDLMDEILSADGFLNQHPITGSLYGIEGWTYMKDLIGGMDEDIEKEIANSTGNLSYEKGVIKGYRNKLFGAPFQFLDSVDARFSEVNEYVGFEFLKNFLIHAPILHIFPGVPKYTGGEDNSGFIGTLFNWARAFGMSQRWNNSTNITDLLNPNYNLDILKGEGAKTLFQLFFKSKLQKRMFGIKFKYEIYQRYVHLMCKAVAILLKLDNNTLAADVTDPEGGKFYPSGTFVNTPNGKTQFVEFTNFDDDKFGHVLWNNYRMIEDVMTYSQESGQTIWSAAGEAINKFQSYKEDIDNNYKDKEKPSMMDWLKKQGDTIGAFGMAFSYGIDKINERPQSVEFLVEPISADETYNNTVSESAISGMVDGISEIGSEVAFITGSGALNSGGVTAILDGAQKITKSALEGMADASKHFAGNFVSNLLTGGLGAITGNRFIYPKIYKRSNSQSSHSFKIKLISPYGDLYNYYMNIIVPLCHIYALGLPHLKTSNSSSAPFIVRAFIPGLKTIEMGMISSIQVTKNPNINRVTINGFPLDLDVTIQIEELYNVLAISPTDDALSFFQNETLSDYLCNLAGVFPTGTREKMMKAGFMKMVSEQFNVLQQANNAVGDYILNLIQILT